MDFWKVRFGNGCHTPGRAYCQYFSPALRVEIEESVNPGFQHPGSLVIDLSFLYVPIVVFLRFIFI